MITEPDEPLNDFYELTDEDFSPFDSFEEADFERWLRVGLENYLLEGKGAWAFPEAVGTIARWDYLVPGLHDVYCDLPPISRGYFRSAVAKVLASLEAEKKYVTLFEHLLSLAAALPAPEILRVLPARVGNGFFGLLANDEDESLFSLTLLTVARLAAPRDEAVDCLHALIGSQHFDCAYAGIALAALCRADDRGLTDHMARLRDSLAQMFEEFSTDAEAKREFAKSVLGAVGLHRLIQALPQLKYFDASDEYAALDGWLIDALLGGDDALLGCIQTRDAKLKFYLTNKPEAKVQFLGENIVPHEVILKSLDIIDLLKKRRYVKYADDLPPIPSIGKLNKRASELVAAFNGDMKL